MRKVPKVVSPDEAVSVIQSGDSLYLSGFANSPELLVEALCRRGDRGELRDVRIIQLMTFGKAPYTEERYAGIFIPNAFFAGANNRQSMREGISDYLPVGLSDTQQLYRSGTFRCDVALIKVTTPDEHGYVSLGVSVDITLAAASNALVIGFNVRPTPRAQALAEQEKVEIRKYNIIYDVVDDIKAAMEGMLSPEIRELDSGKAEVREVFRVPKVGLVAGCYILEGKVTRNCFVRVIRDSIQINKENIHIASLKRFKDDAKEVTAGYECGIGLEDFQDLQKGDILEFVIMQEVARKLEVEV